MSKGAILFVTIIFFITLPLYFFMSRDLLNGNEIWIVIAIMCVLTCASTAVIAVEIARSQNDVVIDEEVHEFGENRDARGAILITGAFLVLFLSNILFAGYWAVSKVNVDEITQGIDELLNPTATPTAAHIPTISRNPTQPNSQSNNSNNTYNFSSDINSTYMYTSNGKGFSFEYPSDWEVAKVSDTTESSRSELQDYVVIKNPKIGYGKAYVGYEDSLYTCIALTPTDQADYSDWDIKQVGGYTGIHFEQYGGYTSDNISLISGRLIVNVDLGCYVFYFTDSEDRLMQEGFDQIVESFKIIN